MHSPVHSPGSAGRGGSRIAFFGGSFDPPHLGHLAIARAALAALQLDAVLFAPVGAQPLKPLGFTAGFADRLEMTRLAIASEPGFETSLADAPQGSGANPAPNYTIDTLERLRFTLSAGAELFCLMGADAFFGLRQWHRAAELPLTAPLIVASRPGQPLEELQSALPGGLRLAFVLDQKEGGVEVRSFSVSDGAGRTAPFYLLPGLDVEISASDIRARIAEAKSIADLLPDAVARYIQCHNLYR
jgi:nicotinate-nucleotide adenylyltransferase